MKTAHRGKRARQALAILGLTLTLGFSACLGAPAPVSPQAVAAANTGFGLRLLQETCKDNAAGNVFLSPFSVSQALTMALNGAGGATQADMARTLGLNGLSTADVNAANGALLSQLTKPEDGVELSVANALWAAKGVQFPPDFRQRVHTFYGGEATTLDLRGPSAAPTINAWVKAHTGGKIDNLVGPADLRQAVAVLTNAVFFHGRWSVPFNPGGTSDAGFTGTDGTRRTVPMMSRVGDMEYAETEQFQAVALPYGAGRLRMVLLLPKNATGLDAVLASLDSRAWNATLAGLRPTHLALFLPRFKADTTLRLNKSLISLGMAPAFGGGADFRPMGLGGGFIGAVIHKAVLDVNEDGTTAAAATAVVQSRGIGPRLPAVQVRADHPFLFTLWDGTTGTLLFAGAIRDPHS